MESSFKSVEQLPESKANAKREFHDALHKLTLKSSFWTILGHGWLQALRFAGNLILTRLLIPADFGLMQLVFVFIQSITMFSDLGMSYNVIQHEKGSHPSFLRSVWTVQLLRGIFIELMLCAIAYPIAAIYQAPPLAWLIPLAGINAIIEGLASTNVVLLNRNMQIGRLTVLNMVCELIGMLAMIVCAWFSRSVWSLLVFSFVSSGLKTLLSHTAFEGPSMRLRWHFQELMEIFNFGRWIFLSSAAGFLVSKLDRLILGLYLTLSDLGCYGIAYAIAMMMYDTQEKLGQKVLVPLYANLWRRSPSDLKPYTLKIRSYLSVLTLLPVFCLIIWGEPIIHFLYPANYQEAGWMLRILAVGCCLKCMNSSIDPILLSVGHSFRMMLLVISGSILLIVSFFVGGHYFGTKGLIWAIPMAELLNYPVIVALVRPYGVWIPAMDFTILALTGLVFYLS